MLVALVLGTLVATVAPATVAAARDAVRPSAKARMICSHEAREDLAGVLAAKAKVSSPVWRDRRYRCTYRYPTGSFTISVTEHPTVGRATQEFTRLSAEPDVARPDLPMGDAAFARADGSLVLRKDRRILEVDPTGMPASFSTLGLAPPVVAETVAMTILGCWTG